MVKKKDLVEKLEILEYELFCNVKDKLEMEEKIENLILKVNNIEQQIYYLCMMLCPIIEKKLNEEMNGVIIELNKKTTTKKKSSKKVGK